MSGGLPQRVLRRVIRSDLLEDTLVCGHTVRDYERQFLAARICPECEAEHRAKGAKRRRRTESALARFYDKAQREFRRR